MKGPLVGQQAHSGNGEGGPSGNDSSQSWSGSTSGGDGSRFVTVGSVIRAVSVHHVSTFSPSETAPLPTIVPKPSVELADDDLEAGTETDDEDGVAILPSAEVVSHPAGEMLHRVLVPSVKYSYIFSSGLGMLALLVKTQSPIAYMAAFAFTPGASTMGHLANSGQIAKDPTPWVRNTAFDIVVKLGLSMSVLGDVGGMLTGALHDGYNAMFEILGHFGFPDEIAKITFASTPDWIRWLPNMAMTGTHILFTFFLWFALENTIKGIADRIAGACGNTAAQRRDILNFIRSGSHPEALLEIHWDKEAGETLAQYVDRVFREVNACRYWGWSLGKSFFGNGLMVLLGPAPSKGTINLIRQGNIWSAQWLSHLPWVTTARTKLFGAAVDKACLYKAFVYGPAYGPFAGAGLSDLYNAVADVSCREEINGPTSLATRATTILLAVGLLLTVVVPTVDAFSGGDGDMTEADRRYQLIMAIITIVGAMIANASPIVGRIKDTSQTLAPYWEVLCCRRKPACLSGSKGPSITDVEMRLLASTEGDTSYGTGDDGSSAAMPPSAPRSTIERRAVLRKAAETEFTATVTELGRINSQFDQDAHQHGYWWATAFWAGRNIRQGFSNFCPSRG